MTYENVRLLIGLGLAFVSFWQALAGVKSDHLPKTILWTTVWWVAVHL